MKNELIQHEKTKQGKHRDRNLQQHFFGFIWYAELLKSRSDLEDSEQIEFDFITKMGWLEGLWHINVAISLYRRFCWSIKVTRRVPSFFQFFPFQSLPSLSFFNFNSFSFLKVLIHCTLRLLFSQNWFHDWCLWKIGRKKILEGLLSHWYIEITLWSLQKWLIFDPLTG